MYRKIQPLYLDRNELRSDMVSGKNRPNSEYYKEGEPITLNLDTIKRITREKSPDDSISLARIILSDDRTEDIIVSEKEAEDIDKILLKNKKESLTESVERLCSAIHSLHELLRARLR